MPRPADRFVLCILASLLTTAAGCPKKASAPKEAPPAEPSQPAEQPEAPNTPPDVKQVPAQTTQPVASRPADKPDSTYENRPPYTVQLFVLDPKDEEQPGWVRIVELADENAIATAVAEFPSQNSIEIDTRNVRHIRIHVSHLPLDQRKRSVLHIDDQHIALSSDKDRDYIYMERRTTGEWVFVDPPEDPAE